MENNSFSDQLLSLSSSHKAFWSIMYSLLIILICFGNILVIVAFVKFDFLHSFSNVFIVNLAAADLLVGVSLPIRALIIFKETQNKYLCLSIIFQTILYMTMSLLSLLGISAERTIKILRPLSY